MPDLSQLNLKSDLPEEIDYEHYVDPSEFPPPPPEGVYTLLQGKATFEATPDGYLSVNFAGGHTIDGGDLHGKPAYHFDRVSNKPFKRQGTTAAMIIDHIRSLGDRTPYKLSDANTLAGVIELAEGKPFKVQGGWEAYCKDCVDQAKAVSDEDGKKMAKRVTVRGARNFPDGPGGQKLDSVPCPNCGNPLPARARIVRRIPA